ncbi:hypothetical protein [Pacificibacter marinus]|uniref:hypothetical protein n=1 Tax=Pacificibacter marinus TaxID=658057 RepID=UPI001FCD4020|nr:hypothetical protein [Pacificibacter marinus]
MMRTFGHQDNTETDTTDKEDMLIKSKKPTNIKQRNKPSKDQPNNHKENDITENTHKGKDAKKIKNDNKDQNNTKEPNGRDHTRAPSVSKGQPVTRMNRMSKLQHTKKGPRQTGITPNHPPIRTSGAADRETETRHQKLKNKGLEPTINEPKDMTNNKRIKNEHCERTKKKDPARNGNNKNINGTDPDKKMHKPGKAKHKRRDEREINTTTHRNPKHETDQPNKADKHKDNKSNQPSKTTTPKTATKKKATDKIRHTHKAGDRRFTNERQRPESDHQNKNRRAHPRIDPKPPHAITQRIHKTHETGGDEKNNDDRNVQEHEDHISTQSNPKCPELKDKQRNEALDTKTDREQRPRRRTTHTVQHKIENEQKDKTNDRQQTLNTTAIKQDSEPNKQSKKTGSSKNPKTAKNNKKRHKNATTNPP